MARADRGVSIGKRQPHLAAGLDGTALTPPSPLSHGDGRGGETCAGEGQALPKPPGRRGAAASQRTPPPASRRGRGGAGDLGGTKFPRLMFSPLPPPRERGLGGVRAVPVGPAARCEGRHRSETSPVSRQGGDQIEEGSSRPPVPLIAAARPTVDGNLPYVRSGGGREGRAAIRRRTRASPDPRLPRRNGVPTGFPPSGRAGRRDAAGPGRGRALSCAVCHFVSAPPRSQSLPAG